MTVARAQFRFPTNSRNIIDTGDFYYMGPYLAGKDMKPISFDRVLPNGSLNAISVNQPLSLKGHCATLQTSTSGYIFSHAVAGAQAFFSDTPIDTVFSSTLGITAGKKYTIAHKGTVCEIKPNAELEDRGTLNASLSDLNYIEFTYILAENTDAFFVVNYSRYASDGSTNSSDRISIIRINKADFTSTRLLGSSAQTSSSTNSTSNLIGRGIRYLGRQADGKYLFLLYRTHPINTSAITSNWYATLDISTSAGIIAQSATLTTDPVFTYSSSIPTGLFPTATVGYMGNYYRARQDGNDDVKIVRRGVQSTFSTIPNYINSTAASNAEHKTCTITGMPNGVVLPTPGVSIIDGNNLGQISMWRVTDSGGKEYVAYFTHNGACQVSYESNPQTPISRSALFIFEVDAADDSNLIYRSHALNGFGYSQQIMTVLFSVDRKIALVANSSGFGLLSWSDDAKAYVASPWRPVANINRISFDQSSQIWVENTSGELFLFNPDLSASINVTFEEGATSILYSGTTVGINVNIGVFNFVGTRQARDVRLVAKGCTFTDGSTTKDITTATSADSIERVFISGQGNVSVDAFLL